MARRGESGIAVVDDAGRIVGLVPPHRLLAVLLTEHDAGAMAPRRSHSRPSSTRRSCSVAAAVGLALVASCSIASLVAMSLP